MNRFRHQGCSFISAGRLDSATGQFKGLADIDVPPQLADMFAEVPEGEFRVDISSTELRKRAAEAGSKA